MKWNKTKQNETEQNETKRNETKIKQLIDGYNRMRQQGDVSDVHHSSSLQRQFDQFTSIHLRGEGRDKR